MYTEAELVEEIEAFCKRHKIPTSTFGIKALGNPNFVGDLKLRAKSPKLKTVRKLLAFMEREDAKLTRLLKG